MLDPTRPRMPLIQGIQRAAIPSPWQSPLTANHPLSTPYAGSLAIQNNWQSRTPRPQRLESVSPRSWDRTDRPGPRGAVSRKWHEDWSGTIILRVHGSAEIRVYTDSWDSLLVASEQRFKEKFSKFDGSVVFGAEHNLGVRGNDIFLTWQFTPTYLRYPEIPTPYRSLNAGGFMDGPKVLSIYSSRSPFEPPRPTSCCF